MILEQSFQTVSEPVKRWFATSYLGKDLREGRPCRLHLLPLEPTSVRMGALDRKLKRLQGLERCLPWYGHGRVLNKSLWVAEQLHGESLEGRRLEEPELRRLALDGLEALGELHARGLVHGAVAPELFYGDGQGYRLGGLYIDLGWNSLRTDWQAPERKMGLRSGWAADLYAFGSTLVQLGTGQFVAAQAVQELESLLGLGALLHRDPDRRPSAKAAGEHLVRRPKRKSGLGSGDELASALAAQLIRERRPLALQGAAEAGCRFLLEGVACELEGVRSVWLEAAPEGDGPFGLASRLLERLRGRRVEGKEQERFALKSALEDELGQRSEQRLVLLVANFEEADLPSRRLVTELCSALPDVGLLVSWESEASAPFEAIPVRQAWRWSARWGEAQAQSAPVALSDWLSQRNQGLEPAARSLLEAAAVAPTGWQLEELVGLAGADAEKELYEAADELVRRGLLWRELGETGAEHYRLEHPALKRGVEATLEVGRSAEMHRWIAEMLELMEAGQAESQPFLLHFHLARAGAVRPGLLGELCRRSAMMGDIERARLLIAQHAEAFAELSVLNQLELLELADDLDAAAELCGRLLQGASIAEEGLLRLHLGEVLRRQSDFDAAYRELARSWELRESLGEGQKADLAMDLANVCSQLGRLEETMQWLDRVGSFVLTASDPGLRARYIATQADLQRRLGRGDVAVRELQKARAMLPPSHPDLPGLLTKLGKIHVEQGDMEQALDVFRESVTQGRALGRRSAEEVARFNVAWLLLQMERLEAAGTELESLLLEPLRPTIRARVLGLLGTVAGLKGRLDEARSLFGNARSHLREGDNSLRRQFALDEALLLLDHGQPLQAEELLKDLQVPSSGDGRAAYLATSALLSALLDRLPAAARFLEELGQSPDPVAWEARGELLMRVGSAPEAVDILEAGLRVHGPLSSGYRRGMLLVRQARALLHAGRRRRSALVLRQGLEHLASAPGLAEKLGSALEQELKGGGSRSNRAYLEALLSLSELLHRQRDARAIERAILEGVLDLLGLDRVQLVVYHPVTAEPRLLSAISGGGVEESRETPEWLEELEVAPEPRPWSTGDRSGRVCSLTVDEVQVGFLVLEGGLSEADGELNSFLKTYSSLSGLALVRAAREEELLRRTVQTETGSSEFLVGKSSAMIELMAEARAMAGSDSHILILGESGVGKTQLAREIHRLSRRRAGPFVAVDLASEPMDLVSANLFGHEKGAFTGATQAKDGYIAHAQGGTLFLDEIADIQPQVQQKLLLFLQNKMYRPVGSNREKAADVRVILATNKVPETEIAAGRFRQDLYYRLSGLTLRVAPLRERREDVRAYCEHFFRMFCHREQRDLQGIAPAAMAALVSQTWPGNLRDLMNCLQRAVLLAPEGGWIEPVHLSVPGPGRTVAANVPGGSEAMTLAEAREALDRRMLVEALAAENYNRSRTARRLGLTRQGLLGMLKRYEIDQ